MTEPLAPRSTAATTTNGVERPAPTRFAIVGSGWRSRVYLDLANACPDLFTITGLLARSPERGGIARERGVPVVTGLDELLADRPDFVVLSVPWPVTPELTRELVGRGVFVLAETPPAPDLDGLRTLWADVGASGLVAVAEQYLRYPLTAAVAALVAESTIGAPVFAHVSSTHEYHAVAMLRALLGAGRGPATVMAQTVTAPLLDPIDPTGWTGSATPAPADHTLATVLFENGTRGLYDFTDNQWWNPLRSDVLTVRGSHGEIHNGEVVRMHGVATQIRSRLERSVTGHGMNLEGADTTTVAFDGRILYRNAFEGGRLSDDELAVAELVAAAGAWSRGDADAPYPLAEACHDHAIALAIRRAATDGTQRVEREAWA